MFDDCLPGYVIFMPKIREALFDDYEAIMQLVKKYGLKTKARDEWLHLWVNNPLLIKDGLENWPTGWVLLNDDKEVVGYLGNIPIGYEFQGVKMIAAVSSSWNVPRMHS